MPMASDMPMGRLCDLPSGAMTFMAIQTDVKKIMAPLGRSQSLPIGMSDAIGINDKAAADRLQIKYVC